MDATSLWDENSLFANDAYPPQVVVEQSITPDEVSESVDLPQEPEHQKDGKYYLEFVTLLVEDSLFMVPKHHFMRYEDQFDWMKDTDEETPHTLDGIVKDDFKAFLKFLHPLYLPYQPNMATDEWVSVLKLTSKWLMVDIREMAIKALDNRTWIEKISLARTYGVATWLRNGYINFASRQESLSVNDAQVLGLETALKLMNIREEALQKNRDQVRENNAGWHGSNVDSYTTLIHTCCVALDDELFKELGGVNSALGADAVERVLWARSQNNVQSLRLAYIELTGRREPISLDEASKLGLATTTNICRARERLLRLYPNHRSHSLSDFNSKIASAFMEELDTATKMSTLYRGQEIAPALKTLKKSKKIKK